MRTYDFSPLFRSTVGFDRLQRLMDSALTAENNNATYPPYNIEVHGENAYRITMAVAGFSEEELDITVQENSLIITGGHGSNGDKPRYLHHGIANRGFERRFQLADHIRVVGASLVNGMLNVELEREVPEALKPRKIEILGSPKALQDKKAA